MLNSQTFTYSLSEICTDYQQAKFLLAVSGGVDSMVLMSLFKDQNLDFEVAHINYGLRGIESEADENLVQKICTENKTPFHLYKVSAKDEKPKNSIQNWARDLRYDFFRKILQQEKIDFIVTAHHLNDQLETFIINLSKASGIKGLTGIPANENQNLRPLLHFSKEEIYHFAKENKIEFREDLSNQKNDYLRNFIRNEITPHLLEVNDHFLENFGKSLSYLKDTKNFVEEKIVEIEKEITSEKDSIYLIDKNKLFAESEFVQFEILRKYTFDDIKEISKIKKAESGKTFLSSEYELTIDRETLNLKKLTIENAEENSAEILLEINVVNEVIFPENIQEEILESGKISWKLDLEKVGLPLKLRRKKANDTFHPIGMIGKKKIAKFFKDEKIPIFAQPKIWLLCDRNDEVLGILPFRQDRRFAANKESKKIIKVKL